MIKNENQAKMLEIKNDDEYMKQKYCFNILANHYGRVKKWWQLNSILEIKTDWRIIV